jgi:hypothetical protein
MMKTAGNKLPAMSDEEVPSPEIAKKLAQLAHINSNLEKLNETEPLPPEFDAILAQWVQLCKDAGYLSIFILKIC